MCFNFFFLLNIARPILRFSFLPLTAQSYIEGFLVLNLNACPARFIFFPDLGDFEELLDESRLQELELADDPPDDRPEEAKDRRDDAADPVEEAIRLELV